jgi:hypothetical protein
MAIRAAGLSVFVAAMLTHGSAQAGCGSVCVMSEPRLAVEPEFACAWAETMSNDCGCIVRLIVHNECATPLDALNFNFGDCRSMGVPASASCVSLAPKTQGSFEMRLNDTGRNERTFTLLSDGQEHAVRVEVDVSSIDDGGMCSAGGRPGSGGTPWLIALVFAGLRALVARRDKPTRDCHLR